MNSIISLVDLIYSHLKPILYLGNNVVCPVCGGNFSKFLPYKVKKVKKRLNVLCPRCGSFERHRLLWLFLINRTNLFSDNMKILHLAPEHVFQKIFRTMPNLNYVSADICSPLAEIKTDITNISFKNNSFDTILCIHILEHITKDQEAMAELFRILKPGGWAILQSPVNINLEKTFEDTKILSIEDREKFLGQSDHVRMYGKDYKERLESMGFKVNVDDFVKYLDIDLIKKYGLLEEYIYFCTKE